MSEQKAAIEVKQEGDFKIKSKPKRKTKNLSKTDNETVKVDLTKPEAQGEVIPEVAKIDLTEKPKEDAIQIEETKSLPLDESSGDSKKVDEEIRVINTDEDEKPVIESIEKDVEVKEEPVKQETKELNL